MDFSSPAPGDEERPVCGQCSKKDRTCSWETSGFHIRQNQPNGSARAGHSSADQEHADGVDGKGEGDEMEEDQSTRRNSLSGSRGDPPSDRSQRPAFPRANPFQTSAFRDSAASSEQYSPGAGSSSSGGQSFFPRLFHENSSLSSGTHPEQQTQILTRDEAELVHHYSEQLGRWLDCTDASKQFTRQIPLLVQQCPILRNAVLAFAAKHRKDVPFAEQAYQRCLNLLIDRLNSENVTHDDAILCAIVTLRFVEQLDGM
jgi:hypothetical protein